MFYLVFWVFGLVEISDGFLQIWGGIYLCNNDLYQVQGVKVFVVLVNCVLSIVSQFFQLYIYMKLEGDYLGFCMFEMGGLLVWQCFYLNVELCCGIFGVNDLFWLIFWGDGNMLSGEGYVWNVWCCYECCQKVGQIFFSFVYW